jgi:small subunit ribosomal protein S16
MAVVIRLRRAGSKKRPFYHMIVADSRMRRDGRFIEKVGHYNPIPRQEEIAFDQERIDAWVAKGAKLSTTVERLIRRHQRGTVGPSTKERKRAQAKGAAAEAAVTAPAGAEAAPAESTTAATPESEAAPASDSDAAATGDASDDDQAESAPAADAAAAEEADVPKEES